MWTWGISIVLGAPDAQDVAAWSEAMEAAALGPDGCWDVQGHVTWSHHRGDDANEGQADFTVRFDDHHFGSFFMDHLTTRFVVDGEAEPGALALQFRPRLGAGGNWWVVSGKDGVYVADAKAYEVPFFVRRGDGAVWGESVEDGLLVRHDRELRNEVSRGATERVTGHVRAGNSVVHRVERELPRHFRPKGTGSWREGSSAIDYGDGGLPASERAEVRFDRLLTASTHYEHAIRYDRFEPCAPGPEAAEVSPGRVEVFGTMTRTPWLEGATPSPPKLVPTAADVAVLRKRAQVHRAQSNLAWTNVGINAALGAGMAGMYASLGDDAEPWVKPLLLGGLIFEGVAMPFRVRKGVRQRKEARRVDAMADDLERWAEE